MSYSVLSSGLLLYRSVIACTVLCEQSTTCTAVSFDESSNVCQLGLKGKSTLQTSNLQQSMSIFKRTGETDFLGYFFISCSVCC